MRAARTVLAMAVIAGFATLAAPPAPAAEAEFDLSAFSEYVWRGQVLNDEPVFQPSIDVAAGNGFSINVWANMDLTDNNAGLIYDAEGTSEVDDTEAEFTEVDLTIDYALPLDGKFGLNVGAIEYVYSHPAGSTREVYVTAGLAVPLNPSLTVSYDFDKADGTYASFDVEQDIPLGEAVTLTFSGSVGYGDAGYNEYSFGTCGGAFNDANAGLAATWSMNEAWSIAGSVRHTVLIDGDIRDAAEAVYYDDQGTVAGLSATCAF